MSVSYTVTYVSRYNKLLNPICELDPKLRLLNKQKVKAMSNNTWTVDKIALVQSDF